MKKRATCDECGGPVAPVLVGLPEAEAMEAAQRGEVILGGCIVEDSIPLATCGCGETTVERSERWLDDPWDDE